MIVSPFQNNHEIPKSTFIPTKSNKYIIDNCPCLAGFCPSWWAVGPHAQTFMQCTFPVPKGAHIYTRELIHLSFDNVEIALDWKAGPNMTCTTPIIVFLHGLGGSSSSRYMQIFTSECVKMGYRPIVYNRRGHGGTSLMPKAPGKQAPKIFPTHVNMEDMEEVVQYIVKRFPRAPKYLVGLSCGANLAINYIAEHPKHPFIATVSISNGYDIWNGTNLLQKNPTSMKVATDFLLDLLDDNKKDMKYMCKEQNIHINFDIARRCRTLQDFESLVVVPGYEFNNLYEYYENVGSHNKLGQVTTPLLCITNKCDPLVPTEMTLIPKDAATKNKYIINIETKNGGHLGWIEGRDKMPWYMKLIFEYFKANSLVVE